MLDSYYKLSVPEELAVYYNVSPSIVRNAKPRSFDSDLIIYRDARGCVCSVKYLTPEKEVLKEVYYDGENISKINHYRSRKLYCTERYKDSLLVSKSTYNTSGHLVHNIEYYYFKAKITGIRKKCNGRDIYVAYKYDDFGRIVCREISLNDTLILEQQYKYDILDRIVEYVDKNQRISVKSMSTQNELISYVITDRMNNEISIENHFTEAGYVYTDIKVNGHCSQVKDTSYVDNVMLKKPYTSEDDIDLIIANLFREENAAVTKRNNNKYSDGIINQSIEYRTLPISMRKRLLYNMAMQST